MTQPSVINDIRHIAGHFRVECFQAITSTGDSNTTQNIQ